MSTTKTKTKTRTSNPAHERPPRDPHRESPTKPRNLTTKNTRHKINYCTHLCIMIRWVAKPGQTTRDGLWRWDSC